MKLPLHTAGIYVLSLVFPSFQEHAASFEDGDSGPHTDTLHTAGIFALPLVFSSFQEHAAPCEGGDSGHIQTYYVQQGSMLYHFFFVISGACGVD